MTATRKFVFTAALFASGLVCVALAAATHVVAPLFVAWAPLLVVPYVLTRPEPGEVFPVAEAEPAAPREASDPGSHALDGTAPDDAQPAPEEAGEGD